MTEQKWTESTVAKALQESRHANSEAWVFLRQVPNGTSMSKTNTADAIAVGCWNSVGGNEVHGYEIKVSRGDWMKEIQDHKKAEAFTKYCHYWWIAAPKGIVKPEEMPSNWGLIEVSEKEGKYTSRIKKAVTRNDNAAIDFKFFSASLRQCKRSDPGEIIHKEEMRREYYRGMKEGKESITHSQSVLDAHKRATDDLKRRIDEFEQASGVKIDQWRNNPTKIGEAVRFILDHGKDFSRQFEQIGRVCDEIKSAINSFNSLETLEGIQLVGSNNNSTDESICSNTIEGGKTIS